ncbi:MAG: hypothetical protein IPP07_09260 [Holophagales bacterium]|jgi:hypothetical protein|nr:hypothetical protein [Holophagales bacterium]MBK9965057.1 hypothetical protein [Holophagales bacterium]
MLTVYRFIAALLALLVLVVTLRKSTAPGTRVVGGMVLVPLLLRILLVK